ncbi:hypothetical protein D3C86_1124370 [compost metagenome]
MTTLDRTVTLTQVTYGTKLITGYLNFNMTRLFYEFLHIDTIVFECSTSFSFSRIVCFFDFRLLPYYAHTFTTTTGSGFQDYRVTHFTSQCFGFSYAFKQAFRTRNYRYTGSNHSFFGSHFITHTADHLRSGSDKFNIITGADFCKVGIFSQESITRVNSIRIGNLGCCHDCLYIQVRKSTLWLTNTYCFISKTYVQAVSVCCGVNRNGFDTHFATGTDNT